MAFTDVESQLFQAQAEVCKTFANPWRLRIVEALGEDEVTVSDLAQRLGARTALVSQHLGLMRERGIVEARREGTHIYYRLPDSRVLTACRLMRDVLLARIERAGALSRLDAEIRSAESQLQEVTP